MKHENNFILYALGSATLLVASAMLLSIPSNYSQYLPANIVSVSAVVDESSFVQKQSMIAGRVYENSQISELDSQEIVLNLSGVTVLLLKDGEDVREQIRFTQTTTDENGVYFFENIPLGKYSIRIDGVPSVNIKEPKPFVSGFSNSWNFAKVEVSQAGVVYSGVDFVVVE